LRPAEPNTIPIRQLKKSEPGDSRCSKGHRKK